MGRVEELPQQPDSPEGDIVESVALPWRRLLDELKRDPAFLHRYDPRQMEELVAAANDTAGYDVILTPRSGDFGRDVIATRSGHRSVPWLPQMPKPKLPPANYL
jgi:restriction system protein